MKYFDESKLNRKYDTVFSLYVFNTIADKEEFGNTLALLRDLSDNIFIAVRADADAIKPTWKFDSNSDGYWLQKGKKPSFQRFFTEEMLDRYFGSTEIVFKDKSMILFKLGGLL